MTSADDILDDIDDILEHWNPGADAATWSAAAVDTDAPQPLSHRYEEDPFWAVPPLTRQYAALQEIYVSPVRTPPNGGWHSTPPAWDTELPRGWRAVGYTQVSPGDFLPDVEDLQVYEFHHPYIGRAASATFTMDLSGDAAASLRRILDRWFGGDVVTGNEPDIAPTPPAAPPLPEQEARQRALEFRRSRGTGPKHDVTKAKNARRR